MFKQFLLFFFLLLLCEIAVPQSISQWIEENDKIPVEKIYIHTDAENYFTGDTLWYKVYLTDSRSGQLIPGAENVYVTLLDASGTPAIQQLLLCVNGQAAGRFTISEKMKSGNYLLQAYTNYLFNFGNESFFYKQLSISRISGIVKDQLKTQRTDNMVADVSFLPEGGVLLDNTTNLVAFKAISRLGYGVNARGTVKDEKGMVVANFKTDYKGMGLFFLTPETGKTYYATIDGFPSFRYKFETTKQGIKIQLVNHTSREVILNIAGNSESVLNETFFIVNMHRGEVEFYQNFVMDGLNKVIKFENNTLKPGINRFVLLDKNLKPVSERLLFSKNIGINSLEVTTDKNTYQKHSEIKLKIDDKNFSTGDDISNLSVAVVHKFAIPDQGFSKNIFSHLLVDSELNGFLESSAELFNDNEISSESKLRLVMLTNGYHSYFWNNVPDRTNELKYRQERGIQLQGVAKNLLTGNIIANGEITLAIQKDDETGFLTQTTDSAGNFKFTGLLFNDTAHIHIQAKTGSGKMTTDPELLPVFKTAAPTDKNLELLNEKITVPGQFATLKYKVESEIKKHKPRAKIVRKENINEKNDNRHFRLYESADFVLEVDEMIQSYDNILDFMAGKIPGVDVSGEYVRIRGTSSFGGNAMPLFLVDGVPLVGSQAFNLPAEVTQSSGNEISVSNPNEQLLQTVRAIPISDVEKIEVLKSAQNTAVFGIKGSNGVIAIYTRQGQLNKGNFNVKGIIEKKVTGYAKYRDFYSPKYVPLSGREKLTDLRTLLWWEPFVKTENGTFEHQFFSSGLSGKYVVICEGISGDGKICYGTAEFEVD